MEAAEHIEKKFQLAQNGVAASFVSFLQRKMIKSKISVNERRVFHPTFLRFMLAALVDSSKTLESLEDHFSQNSKKIDKKFIERLKTVASESIESDTEIDAALKLFHETFPQFLKDMMLSADFQGSEVIESHDFFISFYSRALASLVEMFFRYYSTVLKSKENKSISSNRKRSFSFDSQSSDRSDIGSLSTMKLVSITKSHCIYYVSTSLGQFALKTLRSKSQLAKGIEKLENELKVGNLVKHPSFRVSKNRITYKNKDAVLLEWARGSPISEYNFKELTLSNFFIIARETVSSLLAMHQKKLNHMNLSCEHIIFHEPSKCVTIIGYSSSTLFTSKCNYLNSQYLVEEDLHYISPEQTGFTMKDVDFRTDFYSLGVIFYKILTGIFPFDGGSPYKIIQKHILQEAQPVHLINKDVPLLLSQMISKLMSKEAVNRYQSAKGIMHDLELIISEYGGTKDQSKDSLSIDLAQHDKPELFLVPQKLYGRKKEFATLCSIFETHQEDIFQIVFLSGNSGTGKSTMILEFYKSILKRNGIFLQGKFNITKPRPLCALLEAVKNFCSNLSLMDSATKEAFKTNVQAAVGEEGKLLTDLIPSLNLILGKQPKVSNAFGREAKNRFNYVLLNFFKAICSVNSPMVLILEDLQWLDTQTYDFLHELLIDKSIKNLMLIGSFREDEVHKDHFVTKLVDQAKENNLKYTEIKLFNFDHEIVNKMVSDIFQIPTFEAYSLSVFIFKQTGGNPFFVDQMLNTLNEQRQIYFCNVSMKWKWNSSTLQGKDLAENAIDFLCQKIKTFEKHTQQAIKVASILGSPFSLSVLKIVIKNAEGIKSALSSGIIVQHGTYGRFAHDIIQQAAYSLLPENPDNVKIYIGKKLWRSLSKEGLQENIFTIVNLLQNAHSIISIVEERREIASLFLKAGRKAMLATAFDKALCILDTGIKFLDNRHWQTHYGLCLQIFELASQAAYCKANEFKMNDYMKVMIKEVVSADDIVHTYYLKIRLLNDKRNFQEGLDIGLFLLRMIGINIDLNISDADLETEVKKTVSLLTDVSENEILKLRSMKDRKSHKVMKILSRLLVSSFYANIKALVLITGKMVQLTFDHGISKYSCEGFCSFGHTLQIKGYKSSYKFGRLALMMMEAYGTKESIPSVYIVFYGAIKIWFSSIHSCLDPMLKSYRIGFEVGQKDMSVICVNSYCYYAFQSSKSLIELHKTLEGFSDKLQTKTGVFLSTYQAVLNLLDNDGGDYSGFLKGSEFDIDHYALQNSSKSDSIRCHTNCLFMAYLFHNYSEAEQFAAACKPDVIHMISSYFYAIYILYSGLNSIEIAKIHSSTNSSNSASLSSSSWMNAKECLVKLQKLSEKCPSNYSNKAYLLEALLYAYKKELNHNGSTSASTRAVNYFETSINLAKKYNFLHEEAVACERLGLYLESLSSSKGYNYLERACRCYNSWGASSKVSHIQKLYPSLNFKEEESHRLTDLTDKLHRSSQASISQLSEMSYSTYESSLQRKRVRFS